MDSTESRFVVGPSVVLFGSVNVCTFQTGSFTGCDSEGVNEGNNLSGRCAHEGKTGSDEYALHKH